MYTKKTLELTLKMFPEFEILVEIYKVAFWCIAKKKKKKSLEKHFYLLKPIFFSSILNFLSLHRSFKN